MSKKNRGLIALAVISASMILVTGCGAGNASTQKASASGNGGNATAENVAQNAEDANTEADGAGSVTTGQSEHMDALLGEWVRIAAMGENFYSTTDDMDCAGLIDIYVEDGVYKADSVENEYGYSEYYGVKLNEVAKPDYPGNDPAQWYVQYTRRKAPNITYDIVLLEKDVFKMHIHSTYSYQDEETGEETEEVYDNYEIYVRKDSADIDDIIFKYRYTRTVNVSSIRELYEAIDDNTRIILDSGTYNISELPFEQRNNDNINYATNEETWEEVFYNRDTICVKSVSNLLLEAKEGAQVTICTEDAYEAPLSFEYCNNVTLSGLTLGHMVERGSCSGAVVLINDTSKVTINDCRLYGCGTYGIEAINSYGINVNDTNIYECTYGLVRLYNTGNVTFKECSMHDSTGFDMIDLQNCWTILFDSCSITDNIVQYDSSALINSTSDNVKFTSCRFEGNVYDYFKFGSADLEDCSIKEN